MTYEEKLQIIINAVREARQFTRDGFLVRLYLGTGNGLTRMPLTTIHDILLQLQDDHEIITVKGLPTILKPLNEQSQDALSGRKDYFLIYMLPTFDEWYEKYLLENKTAIQNMDFINMLRIYDLALDIDQQIQLTSQTTVHISLIGPIIRFRQLFPTDTIDMRQEYCAGRINALSYMKKKEYIINFSHNANDWDTVVTINLTLSKFDDFYRLVKNEYLKRVDKGESKIESKKSDTIKSDTPELKVTYDKEKGILNILGKCIKFNKESFRAKVIELLLSKPSNMKKEWSWDEVIETIEGHLNENPQNDKSKLYTACDGLTKAIAARTGFTDLLIFNKTTVQINPKYT